MVHWKLQETPKRPSYQMWDVETSCHPNNHLYVSTRPKPRNNNIPKSSLQSLIDALKNQKPLFQSFLEVGTKKDQGFCIIVYRNKLVFSIKGISKHAEKKLFFFPIQTEGV